MLVFYEAPHRIRGSLSDMLEILGDRVALLARELTKAHEELVVQPISKLLSAPLTERGEFTVVVRGQDPNVPLTREPPDVARVALEIGEMTNLNGLGRREIVRRLAAGYGITSREAYQLLEKAKNYLK